MNAELSNYFHRCLFSFTPVPSIPSNTESKNILPIRIDAAEVRSYEDVGGTFNGADTRGENSSVTSILP